MRVWHSAWSWLNEIVPLDSVAGNTLIGMFTRLIFRKPFQVARAAIELVASWQCRVRLQPDRPLWCSLSDELAFFFTGRTLRLIALVPLSEVQTRTAEVDVVRGDLVAQQP